MTDSKVQMHIPEELISDMIRGEIVRSMPNKGELVASIVRQSLNEKSRGYGNGTKFGEAVNSLIRKEAEKIFAEWVEENRGLIRKAFEHDLLKNKQRHLKTLAAAMVDGIKHFSISVSLNESRD